MHCAISNVISSVMATCLVPMSQGIFRVSIRMWLTLLTMIEQRRAFILGTISLLLLFGCGVFAIAEAMRLSDPKHFDHILPFLQPADVHHSIPLDSDDIGRMHAIDDAATFEAGEHDMQTHAVEEAPDTGEHFTSARADALRESKMQGSAMLM